MSALSGIDIALWDLKGKWTKWNWSLFSILTFANLGKKLGVPIYQLLGGKVRHKLKVYAWIGGDRPNEVEQQA